MLQSLKSAFSREKQENSEPASPVWAAPITADPDTQ